MKTVLFITILCLSILLTSTSAETVDTHSTDSHANSTGSDHGNGTDGHGNDTSHHEGHSIHLASWNFEYVKEPLLITLCLLVAGLCKVGYHHADFLSSIIPESCILIIFGTVIGAIIQASSSSYHIFPQQLSPKMFFLYLLPPSILESAYSLHDRTFVDNLATILVYAVIGTLMNCFVIGGLLYMMVYLGATGSGLVLGYVEVMVFASLIVAVDPVAVLAIFQEVGVNNVLYFLVFGESLFNDAVTVVLYNMMKTFNDMETIPPEQIVLGVVSFFTVSLGGLSIGIIVGVLTAVFTKFTNHVRVVEPLAIFGLAYFSYILAELFHFSGIISLIACGLTQAQYSFHNISHKSHTTVKYFSKMMAAVTDVVIFIFLGLSLVRTTHVWDTGFVLWTVFLCFAVRFAVVFTLTFFVNKRGKLRPINIEEQFIMAYGGLRGAVAFSLVTMLDADSLTSKNMFETTTLVIIIFTVFIQGSTVKPLVKLLRVQGSEKDDSKDHVIVEVNDHVQDHVMAGIEVIVGHMGKNLFRETLERWDDQYLKNWLQSDPCTKDEYIMELYEDLARRQHYETVIAPSTLQQDPHQPPGSPASDEDRLYQSTQSFIHGDEWASQLLNLASGYDGQTGRRRASQTRERVKLRDRAFSDPGYDAGLSDGSQSRKARSSLAVIKEGEPLRDHSSRADIKKLMLKKPQNFHQKYDRNLTHDDDTDLLHHLRNKEARTLRYQFARNSLGSSSQGHRKPVQRQNAQLRPFDDSTESEGQSLLASDSAYNRSTSNNTPSSPAHSASSPAPLQAPPTKTSPASLQAPPTYASPAPSQAPPTNSGPAPSEAPPTKSSSSQDIDRLIVELESQRNAIKGGSETPQSEERHVIYPLSPLSAAKESQKEKKVDEEEVEVVGNSESTEVCRLPRQGGMDDEDQDDTRV